MASRSSPIGTFRLWCRFVFGKMSHFFGDSVTVLDLNYPIPMSRTELACPGAYLQVSLNHRPEVILLYGRQKLLPDFLVRELLERLLRFIVRFVFLVGVLLDVSPFLGFIEGVLDVADVGVDEVRRQPWVRICLPVLVSTIFGFCEFAWKRSISLRLMSGRRMSPVKARREESARASLSTVLSAHPSFSLYFLYSSMKSDSMGHIFGPTAWRSSSRFSRLRTLNTWVARSLSFVLRVSLTVLVQKIYQTPLLSCRISG